MTDVSGATLGACCDSILLGRLGSELALIYHDTLQAPLPAGLQHILDRMDAGRQHGGERTEPAPGRER